MPTLVNLDEPSIESIIEQTGIFTKFQEHEANKKSQESQVATAFIAGLLTIPLLIMHTLFSYLVHLQFGFLSDFNGRYILAHQLPALPAFFILSAVTEHYKHLKKAQFIYFITAVLSGLFVIYYAVDDGTFGAMRRTPGLITFGVLMVIQMELLPACLSIMITALYYYREPLSQLLRTPSLNTEL